MEIGEYHWRDGTYFKRLADGQVRIRRTETAQADSPTVWEVTIPDGEWISIVAHLSASGSTPEAYSAAELLHQIVMGPGATFGFQRSNG